VDSFAGGNVGHARFRPRRAARFVVVALRIVDRVVEPERDFDLGGMLREIADLVEAGKALFEVLERVIAPMRLAIAADQLFIQPEIGKLPALGEVQPYFTL
jgi:hypothetical protein